MSQLVVPVRSRAERLLLPLRCDALLRALRLLSRTVQLVNLLAATHFVDYSSVWGLGAVSGLLLKIGLWAMPVVTLATMGALVLEYVCRQFVYYRLMEHGVLLDFRNRQLWTSKVRSGAAGRDLPHRLACVRVRAQAAWAILFWTLSIVRLAKTWHWNNLVLVGANMASLIAFWQQMLRFEDSLVGLNEFLEARNVEAGSARERFHSALEFLTRLTYVDEARARLNAFEKPLPAAGETCDIAELGDETAIEVPRSRRRLKHIRTEDWSIFVLEYLWSRRGRFADDEDNRFSLLLEKVVAGLALCVLLFAAYVVVDANLK